MPSGAHEHEAIPSGATMQQSASRGQRRLVRLMAALLLVSGIIAFSYTSVSVTIAALMAYMPPEPITETPAALGLAYRNVAFTSREDHLLLRGWFIPGVLPDGRLTAKRTIIVVHGAGSNRADPSSGLLTLEGALARRGFAVLAFDMRGMGQSTPAPFTYGYFEQRDVLGAVDFLRSGVPPYPALGHPQAIGGLGFSMGANVLLLAAAREPAIRAVVADSAYADPVAIVYDELPRHSGLPAVMTPGVLLAAHVLYGVDFYGIRPLDAVARLAPRPVLFISGTADTIIRASNTQRLAHAADATPDAHVQRWLVLGAGHAQSFDTAPTEYVNRVATFFTAALGPDTTAHA